MLCVFIAAMPQDDERLLNVIESRLSSLEQVIGVRRDQKTQTAADGLSASMISSFSQLKQLVHDHETLTDVFKNCRNLIRLRNH